MSSLTWTTYELRTDPATPEGIHLIPSILVVFGYGATLDFTRTEPGVYHCETFHSTYTVETSCQYYFEKRGGSYTVAVVSSRPGNPSNVDWLNIEVPPI